MTLEERLLSFAQAVGVDIKSVKSSAAKIINSDAASNPQYIQLDNGSIVKLDWAGAALIKSVAQSSDWAARATLTYV